MSDFNESWRLRRGCVNELETCFGAWRTSCTGEKAAHPPIRRDDAKTFMTVMADFLEKNVFSVIFVGVLKMEA